MSSANSADDWPRRPEEYPAEPGTSWLDRAWMWPLFGLFGLLVFEFTASSGMAIAIFCVKFGMKDVRLGLWLNRRDPDKSRGQITGLLAASIMGLKITLLGLVVLVLLAVLLSSPFGQLPQNRRAIRHSLFSVSLTTGVAMTISLAISSFGFLLARRAKQRVWLDSTLIRAPQANEWPPNSFVDHGGGFFGRNTVIDLAQFAYLLQLPLVIGIPFMICHWLNVRLRGFEGWQAACVTSVLGAILVTWLMRLNVVRVAAKNPHECWPELYHPLREET